MQFYRVILLHGILRGGILLCPFEASESLMRYVVDLVVSFSLSLLLFIFVAFPPSLVSPLLSSLFSLLFSCFTHTVRSRVLSGIPHRRNNYYYESDPGQETTIVSSFLLLLPTPPSLSPLGRPHTEFTGLVLFSPLVSSHLRWTDGTRSGHTLSGLPGGRRR